MLADLLAHQPSLGGIVADRPVVAAAAAAALAARGLGERARAEAADFLLSVPSAGDVYVMSHVLHDWDDAEALSILRNVRQAMAPAAQLLVVENVLDAPGPHRRSNATSTSWTCTCPSCSALGSAPRRSTTPSCPHPGS
jgi:hypothetical protein